MRFAFAAVACVVAWDGEHVTLTTNDVWDACDPFVVERPDLFRDRPTHVFHTAGFDPESLAEVQPKRRLRG